MEYEVVKNGSGGHSIVVICPSCHKEGILVSGGGHIFFVVHEDGKKCRFGYTHDNFEEVKIVFDTIRREEGIR